MGRGRRTRRAPFPPHPLLAKIRRCLRQPGQAAGFLALLKRRLASLDAVASGADPRLLARSEPDLVRARRFLAARAGSWDDGDEALVRAHLDGWTRAGDDFPRATARRLAEAARALARLEVRPATLWFFLWEMESIIGGLGAAGTSPPKGRSSIC